MTSNESLFDFNRRRFLEKHAPLADRMRPRTLDDFVGQEKIIGKGRLLRRAISADQLSSLIFFGPPGSGKTTLARIIANTTKADFITLNAVLSGIKDIREAVDRAKQRLGSHNIRTILFIDEVHRFNKVQQDALLPHVENGTVLFIGATTENPYFEVNKALLSRSRIFELTQLDEKDLAAVVEQALLDRERGYGKLRIELRDQALEHLVEMANGDARALLNALELAIQTTEPREDGSIVIDRQVAEESIQKKAVLYDKDGDVHYDVISAFIKSVRGSDPDAALYWLAKMVYAGEDPRFIFRRMLILASEDIGMADPQALQVVMSAARTYDYVGLPEGRFALAHACVYLATAPKSNSLFAFFSALESVSSEKEGEVPNHLKDASRDGDGLGHGRNYLYPHAYRDHWVAQQYLPSTLQGRTFYQPGSIGYEKEIKLQVDRRREEQLAFLLERQLSGTTAHDPQFSPDQSHVPEKRQNQWLKRTLENSGKKIGLIRDAMYDLAGCRRDSVLLVLEDPGGILTWEGLRRAPLGGVYAVLKNPEAARIISAQAANLDALERPVIIRGDLDSLVNYVAQREQGLLFDCVLCRCLREQIVNDRNCLDRLGNLLKPEGRIIAAEQLPRFNQRLYNLLPPGSLDESLMKALQVAEESIYGESCLDWCEEEALKQVFRCDTLDLTNFSAKRIDSDIHVSRKDIEHWFPTAAEERARAYSRYLTDRLSEEEFLIIERCFLAHLADRTFPWHCEVGYLTLSRKKQQLPNV